MHSSCTFHLSFSLNQEGSFVYLNSTQFMQQNNLKLFWHYGLEFRSTLAKTILCHVNDKHCSIVHYLHSSSKLQIRSSSDACYHLCFQSEVLLTYTYFPLLQSLSFPLNCNFRSFIFAPESIDQEKCSTQKFPFFFTASSKIKWDYRSAYFNMILICFFFFFFFNIMNYILPE